MAILIRNQFMAGKDNNYLIAGNVCNAFVMGEVGSKDDFFLVGAEPREESNYPLLTGNILDSEGSVLFRLVRNFLVINPGSCSKILSDYVGYEIHDAHGILIFKVRTVFDRLPGQEENSFITTLSGRFFNKRGELALSANSGEPDEQIVANVKCAFGFAGGFGLVQGLSQEELEFSRMVLWSRGKIHEQFRGIHEGEEFGLDGKAVLGAEIKSCKIHVHSGNFILAPKALIGNHFFFHDEAQNLINLVEALNRQKKPGPQGS